MSESDLFSKSLLKTMCLGRFISGQREYTRYDETSDGKDSKIFLGKF